jgi:Uma2 family endonuclease
MEMSIPIADTSQLTLQPISGRPAWEIAYLYPAQGSWSEDDYFALDQQSNRMIEFSDGWIEVLPTPTLIHQLIVRFLFRALDAYVKRRSLGTVLFAPLPVKLWPGKIREPDLIFIRRGRLNKIRRYPKGAGLAVEVVSDDPESRDRDLKKKRKEYAKAGIAEYWIVDPKEYRITVLTLEGSRYRVHGKFVLGTTATSVLLLKFTVNVDEVFAPSLAGETQDDNE